MDKYKIVYPNGEVHSFTNGLAAFYWFRCKSPSCSVIHYNWHGKFQAVEMTNKTVEGFLWLTTKT